MHKNRIERGEDLLNLCKQANCRYFQKTISQFPLHRRPHPHIEALEGRRKKEEELDWQLSINNNAQIKQQQQQLFQIDLCKFALNLHQTSFWLS